MIIIVTGGRNFHDKEVVYSVLDSIPNITMIIQGGASGADFLALQYARHNGIPHKTYEANWKAHGNKAGPTRNLKMLRAHPEAVVVAFPGGNGTKHCIACAKHYGMQVIEIT